MKEHSADAVLLLEDGSLFEGRSVSAGTRFGLVPASTEVREAIESGVDGIVLSNDPGHPEPLV